MITIKIILWCKVVQSGGAWFKVEEDILGKLKKFRGQSEHGLDGKGRLNIPARFRDVLEQTYVDDRVVITPPWEKCLRIYPLQEWVKLESQLKLSATQNPQARLAMRYLVGGAIETKIDKNGRILFPAGLRGKASLVKEVTLAGFVEYFEVWDQVIFNDENDVTPDDFEVLADLGFI
jgi:MraZ protein